MNRRGLTLAVALVLACHGRAHALFVDTFVGGLQYAQDQAYKAFIKIQMIEQLRVLKENYDSSVRYYKEFQRLNQGRGIIHNVAMQIRTAAEGMGEDLERRIDRDFINTYNTDTKVDRFFKGIDRSIADNMRYAGDELGHLIANRKLGVDIARNADGLSPKDAANLAVKAQGLQLQMMAQIHEDNLRLIELHSMQLANDTRRQQAEQRLILKIRKSVERVAPGAVREEGE